MCPAFARSLSFPVLCTAGILQIDGPAGPFGLLRRTFCLPPGVVCSPLLGRSFSVASNVHHHAHFCQQQDQTGAAGREKRKADAGIRDVLVTTAMLQNTCQAICAMMPMPTIVQ